MDLLTRPDRKDVQSPGSPETSHNLTCVSVEWFPNNPNGTCQGTVPEFGSPLRTSKQQHQESTELSLGQSDAVFFQLTLFIAAGSTKCAIIRDDHMHMYVIYMYIYIYI